MIENAPAELESLTWTEARDMLQLRPVGLLPIGAIEAHGPHLPLSTDVIIARGMARYGGARLRSSGIPALVLPAISYSVSFAGACFPGTSPVDPESFQSYLEGVLNNIADQGYRAICLCNAHLEPGHIAAITGAVASAQTQTSTPVLFPDKRIDRRAQELGAEFISGSRHAGKYETSIVMAEAPESVRRVELEELDPIWIDLPAALKAGAKDFAEAGALLGYFGDPGSATPEYGRELLDVLGSMIHDHVLEALVE